MGWHTRPDDDVMFTNIREPRDIQRVIARMKDIAQVIDRRDGMRSIVIGMPNTGKSSMLNVIRRHATDRKWISPATFKHLIVGKAVQTSSQAGLTRTISQIIKVVDDPPIYMSDSPGNPRPQCSNLRQPVSFSSAGPNSQA